MKSKAGLFVILLLWCCMAIGQVRAAEDILFRTAVTPEEPWVGQQVLLSVDVLAKDGWAQLKKIGDVEVDGAYLMRLETQGTRLSEVIAGNSYTGQRYEFMVFPQRDGKITVPPMPVDVEIKTWGVGGGAGMQRRSLPAIEFEARTPPGAQGIRGLISTTDLRAQQSWDPVPDSPTVGDAIERTITLRATDVSGMAFMPMRHARIENLGIYPGEPTVEDKFNRGELKGTRVETVTYVFERPGDIEIPGVVLSWWDVRKVELQRIELPGLSVQVAAGAAVVAEGDTVSEATRKLSMQLVWSVVLAVAVVAALAFRYGGSVLDRFAALRQARRETEAVYFKQVMRSARSGDQHAVLRETMRWLDRINSDVQSARLDKFLREYGDSETQFAAAELMKTLGKQAGQSSLTVFARGLVTARAQWQEAGRIRQQAASVLPALNGGD